MDNKLKIKKLSVAGIILPVSLWFLLLLAQNLWNFIPDSFYEQAGILLGYRTLLNICILLVMVITSLTLLFFSMDIHKKERAADTPTNENQLKQDSTPNN